MSGQQGLCVALQMTFQAKDHLRVICANGVNAIGTSGACYLLATNHHVVARRRDIVFGILEIREIRNGYDIGASNFG